jgi:hypothetical protein
MTFLSMLVLAAAMQAGTGSKALAQQPYRVSDRQVDQVLTRIDSRTGTFRQSLSEALSSSRLTGTPQADEIDDAVRGFEAATNRLQDRFRENRSSAADVQDVLYRANRIESFMRGNRLNVRAQSDWRFLRSELEQLARYYNVPARWNGSGSVRRGYSGLLTGTWRLETSHSDNTDYAIDRATSRLPSSEQQRVRDQIRRRLDAPDTIAIEQRGRRFTIASTRAPQVSFDADGRSRTENINSNRSIRVNASLYGDQLVVSSTGSQGSDYHVTFDPIENGQRLRVTRRIYAERLTGPIVVSSVYEKTSDIAQLNLYSGAGDTTSNGRRFRGPFIVPNDTTLVARLNTNLSTEDANTGDRFSMVVRSPSRYNGAVIEGIVTEVERSGQITGRAKMTLDFERIRLRGGGTYDFKGYIENIRTPDGETIPVDNEGTVREDSQTERTITRSGIGAAIGAIIGAVAGGGKGAAIGAAIGAGAGAGSILVQGRDDLDLQSGTEFTIRSSAPDYTEARR